MHFPQGQRQQPLSCWIGLWFSWLLPERFSTSSAWDGNGGSVGFAGFQVKRTQGCAVKVWDTGEACSAGRAGEMCRPHVLPPSDAVPQRSSPCRGGQPAVLPGPGMARGDTHRARGMRFTTRVKPSFLEWEEGTSPGAKMSVTLLRS